MPIMTHQEEDDQSRFGKPGAYVKREKRIAENMAAVEMEDRT